MYCITNVSNDERKFRDRQAGRDVVLMPGESTFVKKSPVLGKEFKVEKARKSKPKKETKREEEQE